MAKPQDFFGNSVKSILTRPFFHVQDQKAYNITGGTSVAGAWTQRTLNTVLWNDIPGATLGSNQVNLPAGTYYVEGNGIQKDQTGSSFISSIFKDGVKVLQGVTLYGNNVAASNEIVPVSGIVTLSTPGVIDLRYYSGLSMATVGLGQSNNSGSIADTTIPSIYADLKIWQLDRSLEIAPKAINSGLQTIAGMNTEGGIMGGDASVSGNTVTITKCSCMSSDLTIAMALTADTAVALPSTVSQDFYIFVVRLVSNGTFTVKYYTTYAGPSSDATVDKWRFVSYAKNNSSGVTMPYIQKADRIDWLTSTNRPVLTSSTTASYVSYNLGAILPVTLFKDTAIVAAGSNTQLISYDGSTDLLQLYGSGSVSTAGTILAVAAIYLKYTLSTNPVHIVSATLRR